MNVMAIDPGTTTSAWVMYDCGKRALLGSGKGANDDIRACIGAEPRATHLAVEMIANYGMPVGSEVFETVMWIGRFVELRAGQGAPYTLIYRRDVKLHLCGTVRAKDGNVRQALIDKIGPQGTKKTPGPTYGISGDCWSALAVAVTWAETRKLDPDANLAEEAT